MPYSALECEIQMNGRIKPDVTIDCLGFYCPEPVFRTKIAMDKLSIGQILEVVTDDPAAEEDIKYWARNTEQEIIRISKEDGKLLFLIRKVK